MSSSVRLSKTAVRETEDGKVWISDVGGSQDEEMMSRIGVVLLIQASCGWRTSTRLEYRAHVDGGALNHWELARSLEEGEIAKSGATIWLDVEVANARERALKLNDAGFELLENAPTRMETSDFYTPSAVSEFYYKEVEDILKERFGAVGAFVYSHAVRNAEKAGSGDSRSTIQSYGLAPHVDVAAHEAREIIAGMTPRAEARAGRSFENCRVIYVNAWRNIDRTAPVRQYPLALLDAKTVSAPDDFCLFRLETNLYGIDQYRLLPSSQHRWYYYPNMTNEELLVFKQYDTNLASPARFCFHSAFEPRDPSTCEKHPAPSPTRQSIEVRTLLYFDD